MVMRCNNGYEVLIENSVRRAAMFTIYCKSYTKSRKKIPVTDAKKSAHILILSFRSYFDLLKKSDKLLRELKNLDAQKW